MGGLFQLLLHLLPSIFVNISYPINLPKSIICFFATEEVDRRVDDIIAIQDPSVAKLDTLELALSRDLAVDQNESTLRVNGALIHHESSSSFVAVTGSYCLFF